MYLLVGDSRDTWCERVAAVLEGSGHRVLITGDPLGQVSRFSVHLSTDDTAQHFALSAGDSAADDSATHWTVAIEGVFVRSYGGPDVQGGRSQEDAAYLYAEGLAATLAWLAVLPCRIVGSLNEDVWFRASRSVLEWLTLLSSAGLRTPGAHLLTRPSDLRRVRREWQQHALYVPLTGEQVYPLATEAAWNEAERLAATVPVCLLEPVEGPLGSVVVVGEQVIWEGAIPNNKERIEAGLKRLATVLATEVLQVDVRLRDGEAVCMLGRLTPQIDQFGAESLAHLADAVVKRLIVPNGSVTA